MFPSFLPFHEALEKGQTIAIAGLGDSLTYGWQVRKGFFDRFSELLQARHPSWSLRFVNAGVPGDLARDATPHLDDLFADEPDLVLIQFGINDCAAGLVPISFHRDLLVLARRILARGRRVAFATSCPLSGLGYQDSVRPFYDSMRDAAAVLEAPVANLDLFWENRVADGTTGTHKPLHQVDGIHPTDEGHAILAAGLLEAFESWLQPSPEIGPEDEPTEELSNP